MIKIKGILQIINSSKEDVGVLNPQITEVLSVFDEVRGILNLFG